MQSSFKKIAQLEVSHSYFEENASTVLVFTPTKITQQMMAQYGLIFRLNSSGFELYANSTNTIESFLNYLKKVSPAYFEFTIISRDPSFFLYTELPAGTLLYDTDFANSIVNDAQLLTLQTNNTTTSKLGSLILRFEDILKFANKDGFARFCISYAARATQWQYYIINKSELPLNNPVVVGENNINFDGPKEVMIGTGESALLFTSDTLLPLSKIPHYQFDLVSSYRGSTKTLIKGLPAADGIRITRNEKDESCSPIYVYI